MKTFKQYQWITFILVVFCFNGYSQSYDYISRDFQKVKNQRSPEKTIRSFHSNSLFQNHNRSFQLIHQKNKNFSKGDIDTLNFPLAGNYSIYLSDEGYVSGNNEFGDISKVNIFEINEPKAITGILIDFDHATGNSDIEIAVWDNSGNNGLPGNQIGSKVISTSTILNDIQNNNTSFIEFEEPIFTSGNFYAGVKLPDTPGDTIVIYTNTDGDTNPASAWEQWSDNSWVRYDSEDSWNLFVSHAIFPIVDNDPGLMANFYANPTNINPDQNIAFFDTSFGNPTSWEWTFEGGDPGTSTEQNPVVVYTQTGLYDVSLTISDGVNTDTILKENYISVSEAALQVDTLNFPLPGEFALYVIDDFAGGYVCGNNKYNDRAKANYFSNNAPLKITGVLFDFYLATGGNPTIEIGVWDNNGSNNSPGTLLGNKNISLDEIKGDINNQQLSFVEFNTPININHSFFAGFMLPTAAGDTLVVWSNEDGDTSPGIAWDKWEDDTWHPFNNSWQLDLALGIHPIVDYSIGINDKPATNKIGIFPNPTDGIIYIETGDLDNNAEVRIYNSTGVLVFESAVNSYGQDLKIDLSKQENGMYIIWINSGHEIFFNKIIKH